MTSDASEFLNDGMVKELQVRSGLPFLREKIKSARPVRVAYFGGSITAAPGWRIGTMAWFKSRFPLCEFTEVNAAIPGTGTGYGACRLREDVLELVPDLIFVEFRVNGGDGVPLLSAEGLVRQIRAECPQTDICFIYTVSENMREDIAAGRQPAFGRILEDVAAHYGIPTVDLGVEVVRREQDGSLLFKGDKVSDEVLVFTHDGVHPTRAGHELYTTVIAAALETVLTNGPSSIPDVPLPDRLNAAWVSGGLIPVEDDRVARRGDWQGVDRVNDSVYSNDQKRTDGILRGAVRTDQAGASITVQWTGTHIGISHIPHGETMWLEARIDQNPAVSVECRQTSSKALYARYVFLDAGAEGEHTLELTVKTLASGQSMYIGQFMQADFGK